jgi:hypothetical protein
MMTLYKNANWIWLARRVRQVIVGFAIWIVGCIVVQAEPAESAPLTRYSTVLTQRGTDQFGNSVINKYDDRRRLVRAQVGEVGLNYSYSGVGDLLAYAITDKGVEYNVSRDRLSRIVLIAGARSTQLTVAYHGGSTTPSKVTVVLANGQSITPYDQPSGDHENDYSISAIDQNLVQVYEAYAFSSCSPGICAWAN